jgi:hypothetical protein
MSLYGGFGTMGAGGGGGGGGGGGAQAIDVLSDKMGLIIGTVRKKKNGLFLIFALSL